VELNEVQRRALAAALIDVRTVKYGGSRKAAYTAAGVNPATWARVESGEPIKEASLTKIAANIFPSTKGNWRALFEGDAVVIPGEDLPETTDSERLDIAFQLISELFDQLAGINRRLDAVGAPPAARRLSAAPDEVRDAVAAHEEEGSIAGEQEESDTP
jgi:hypothetical protein